MRTLALLGGEPIRTTPFASSVVIDDDEKTLVAETLERGELSRFMGSPSGDMERVLTLTSAEAVDYEPQYFTFLGGRMVRRFEADFAAMFGSRFAVSVNSATSGLSTALAAVGAGPGDEVIVTCLSFNASATSILMTNATPVFVDVDRQSLCLDPEAVRRAITPRTKAILAVHLLGNSADLDTLSAIAREHGLALIEDCAQAPGTRYGERYVGTIGDLGVFSFQETKNMTTGEGGMIVTDDARLAKRCRLVRNHGESIADESTPDAELDCMVGFNFRMTELSAAVGVAQLRKLPENNRVRSENARFLAERLRRLPGLDVPAWVDDPANVIHVLPVLYDADAAGAPREVVMAAIRAEGVPVGQGYQRLMPANPLFCRAVAFGEKHCPFACALHGADAPREQGPWPVAERLLEQEFIWFYQINRPNTLEDMEDVAVAFESVLENAEALRGYDVAGRPKAYKW